MESIQEMLVAIITDSITIVIIMIVVTLGGGAEARQEGGVGQGGRGIDWVLPTPAEPVSGSPGLEADPNIFPSFQSPTPQYLQIPPGTNWSGLPDGPLSAVIK